MSTLILNTYIFNSITQISFYTADDPFNIRGSLVRNQKSINSDIVKSDEEKNQATGAHN